jgi:hypothetical protein
METVDEKYKIHLDSKLTLRYWVKALKEACETSKDEPESRMRGGGTYKEALKVNDKSIRRQEGKRWRVGSWSRQIAVDTSPTQRAGYPSLLYFS